MFPGQVVFPNEQPDHLNDYDILIAPSTYALTEGNLNALADFVMAGGALVRSGPFGTMDENREAQASVPPELMGGHQRVHDMRADWEAYLATKEPQARLDLVRLLVGTLGLQPAASTRDLSANLQLHVRRLPARKALLIDVINRDFQPGRGFRPAV